MIQALRTVLWFVVVTLLLVVAAVKLPEQLARAQVPAEFDDQSGLVPMTGVWLAPPPFAAGDVVAFRFGDGPDDVGFGVVRALPGEQVRLVGGELLVDDNEVNGWKDAGLYQGIHDVGPMTVPAGHLFVVSTNHRYDSLARGVIGPDQVLGKVRE
ncbi:MAG: hypothetical protein J0M02_11920 [Planctomycetes bacterium]|nr:hypothetical protein [Planctomycetota bacterium]